jgi:ribosomal protein S18 acetylase RimI-like enzyme
MTTTTTKKPLASNFVLRTFQPSADHEDCELLEHRANQFRNPKFQKIPILRQLLDSIQIYPRHPQGFDAKPRLLAQEYEIIVVEDCQALPKPRVVAVVACYISRVSFGAATNSDSASSDPNTIKAGWVYGLRVDEDYQRRGLGSALQEELERRCLERHVDMLYLTVNRDNKKAKSLYQALSYQHASHRSTTTKFLTSVTLPTSKDQNDIVVLNITHIPSAAAITAQQYQDWQLCPVPADSATHSKGASKCTKVQNGFVEMFQAPHQMYHGTFVAFLRSELPSPLLKLLAAAEEDVVSPDKKLLRQQVLHKALATAIQNGSVPHYGAISLWNSSAVKGFQVVRFGVSKETWLSPWFQFTLGMAVLALLAPWSKRVVVVTATLWRWKWIEKYMDTVMANDEVSGYWRAMWMVLWLLEIALLGVTIKLAMRTSSFFRFLVTRDSGQLQARAFAPCHFGLRGLDCLQAAVTASQVHAKEQGFAMWAMNVDQGHASYAHRFGKGFTTQFWQKWLRVTPNASTPKEQDEQADTLAKSGTTWNPFSTESFCDPRHF